MKPALLILSLAAALSAQDFQQRGYLDLRTILFPQNAANDSGRANLELVLAEDAQARKALQAPAMKSLMEGTGFEAVANTPEEFRAFVQSEMKRYAEIVRAANVRAE